MSSIHTPDLDVFDTPVTGFTISPLYEFMFEGADPFPLTNAEVNELHPHSRSGCFRYTRERFYDKNQHPSTHTNSHHIKTFLSTHSLHLLTPECYRVDSRHTLLCDGMSIIRWLKKSSSLCGLTESEFF